MYWIGPLLRARSLQRFFGGLTHPLVALPLVRRHDLAVARSGHLRLGPPLGRLALCGTRLVFRRRGSCSGFRWSGPIRVGRRWSPWLLDPVSDSCRCAEHALVGSAHLRESAALSLLHRAAAAAGAVDRCGDQAAAGVIMWVPGSVAFLVPLFAIGVRLLFSLEQKTELRGGSRPAKSPRVGQSIGAAHSRLQLPVLQEPPVSAGFDLLDAPLLGRFLRWRHARVALQLPLAVLAAVLILDGLRGPQIAAVNLAGVLPWIHWRGLLILALLVAGNFFCMACPFTLPRRLAGRWLGLGRVWPRVAAHEMAGGRALWRCFSGLTRRFRCGTARGGRPGLRSATSSRRLPSTVCFPPAPSANTSVPIGQFNFVQSLVSPLEVKVRSPIVCVSCTTHECIRGSDGIPGCQIAPLSAAQVEQHGLHVLSRLRPCLPA